MTPPRGDRPLTDMLGRAVRDLRISVTDRCNFRCTYCMPKEVFGRDFSFLDRDELLTFEEIARVTRLFVRAGITKVRLTGGEPLLRRDLDDLVERIASIRGVDDIALTTNGSLLTRERAQRLKRAGLRRVSVSLDSLDDATFRAMNDVDFPVRRVLDAIESAAEAGLSPVKIDVVVKRGINDSGIIDLARHFRGSGHIVRFIEYMDVGNSNGWRASDVIPGDEIIAMIAREWPLMPVGRRNPGEVAERYAYEDGAGEVGIITSVSRPFCGACTRARLTANGEIFLCLFAGSGHDVRKLLRNGASDDEIFALIAYAWSSRDDRYSELRSIATHPPRRVEMPYIGG